MKISHSEMLVGKVSQKLLLRRIVRDAIGLSREERQGSREPRSQEVKLLTSREEGFRENSTANITFCRQGRSEAAQQDSRFLSRDFIP